VKHFPSTTVLIAAALGAWIGVMWLDNEVPYVYDVSQSHIFPDPAPQNSMVRADWALAHVNRICPGSVQRYFTNADTGEVVATMDTTPVSTAVRLGDNKLPRAFQLPPGLPEHVGYFAHLKFHCNLLQHFFPLIVPTPIITFHTLPASEAH
jgi:hypothetical protein